MRDQSQYMISCPSPPPFIFVPPSPLFQWVRLGQEARGPSAAAREGDRGTKIKGGGGGTRNLIQYWENLILRYIEMYPDSLKKNSS